MTLTPNEKAAMRALGIMPEPDVDKFHTDLVAVLHNISANLLSIAEDVATINQRDSMRVCCCGRCQR